MTVCDSCFMAKLLPVVVSESFRRVKSMTRDDVIRDGPKPLPPPSLRSDHRRTDRGIEALNI